jgi:hypothetical protein
MLPVMQRLTLFAVIGVILGHFGPVKAAQDMWKPVAAGGMSVLLPCTGDWNTSKQDVPEEAAMVTTNILRCKTADAFYLVMWSEIVTKNRFDGMAALRAGRDSMLKRAGGAQLMTGADIVHDGLRGVEFTASLRDTTLLSSRGVFQANRMYQVTIGTPLNEDRTADITRVLTSLKISR